MREYNALGKCDNERFKENNLILTDGNIFLFNCVIRVTGINGCV